MSLSMQSLHEMLTANALWKSNFCPPGYLRGEKNWKEFDEVL